MRVVIEMHNTGDPEQQRDVVAIVEHVLSDRPGDWRVVIFGSQDPGTTSATKKKPELSIEPLG
jgi:hypothetical protein